jgi:hypothetical protein
VFGHNKFLEFRTKLNAGAVESANDTFTKALGTNESTEFNGITSDLPGRMPSSLKAV